MKHILFKKRVITPVFLFLSGILALSLATCSMDDGDYAEMSELGAKGSDYIVPATAGEVDIEVLTNQTYELSFGSEIDWASFPTTKVTGDGTFKVLYEENASFPRMVAIYIDAYSVSRSDTVFLKQEGSIMPKMDFNMTSTTVLGGGGRVEADIDTNLKLEDIKINIVYSDPTGAEWIQDNFSIENGKFIFAADANPSETALRNAKIELSFVDGWGEKIVSNLFLTQANALDLFGTEASFLEVRDMEGGKVTEDIYIEGYIISDAGNMNVADCPNTTTTAIDYTVNDKTAYIQSIDGKYGFRIMAATVADNIFTRYSKVQLLLKGTSVTMDTDPYRYTISGVTSDMVMTSESGSASDLVKKERYISDLTDDDIYTFVTLKDCEFPVRKGPLTPINEGYSTAFNANRISKFPLLMRDIKGNSMYLMTNTKCPYRRDGSTLPYGSGTVSGVIVHERFTRYEFEDTNDEETYGYIGRYQIRHLTKEDIDFSKDFDNGFSALLTEFRYCNLENGVLLATNGNNGKMTTTVPSKTISATSDYTYLGPIGASNMGNTNGNGVIKDDGTKLSTSAATNSDGKGAVVTADNSAWSLNCEWWNYEKQQGEAWVLEFSTAGVSTNQLSLQLAAMNWSITGPRFWRIEWSTHGNAEGVWNLIDKYSVPEAPAWANTTLFQLPGAKAMNFPLPQNMLGQSKVFIRFIVDKNLCSDGYSYANTPITAASSSSMNYLAIRYNK